MTDNDIKKALECLSGTAKDWDCDKCPFDSAICTSFVAENTLDLINRLEAENSNLTSDLTSLKKDLTSLQTEKDNLIKTYSECQVANLKEYANRLKKQAEVYTDFDEDVFRLAVGISKIDSTLKEMVGEQ